MIVICTPTGTIGRQVLAHVLDRDTSVRVIARDPSRLPIPPGGRYEVVQGSLDDRQTVSRAFEGADTVFWLLPPDPRAPDVMERTVSFAQVLSEGLSSRQVRRLVYVAGLGHKEATEADATGRALDELIEKTGVSSRALRMPAFMENMLWQAQALKHQGMFFYPVRGDLKLPSVATRDIAAVAGRLLLDDSWSGQDYQAVLGPEDLSYNDMAEIMTEVFGKPIRYQQVPAEGYKATLIQYGQSESAAQWLVDLLTAIDAGMYSNEKRTPEATTPTTFRQFAEEVLKPVVMS